MNKFEWIDNLDPEEKKDLYDHIMDSMKKDLDEALSPKENMVEEKEISIEERNYAKGFLCLTLLYCKDSKRVIEIRDSMINVKESTDIGITIDKNDNYILHEERKNDILSIKVDYIYSDDTRATAYSFSMYRKDIEEVFSILLDEDKKDHLNFILVIEYILSIPDLYDDKKRIFEDIKSHLYENTEDSYYNIMDNIIMFSYKNKYDKYDIEFYNKIGPYTINLGKSSLIDKNDLDNLLTLIENMHFCIYHKKED